MSTGSSPSIGCNTAPLPPPRTSRFLGSVSQFSTASSPILSAASIPVLASRGVNSSSNSLVGQLLSVSGNAGTAGATPYGMIVSASTSLVPDDASRDNEQDDGGGGGGGGVEQKLDMRQHSHHLEVAENVPPELKIPLVVGYTDLSAVYAIVRPSPIRSVAYVLKAK